MSGMRLAGSQIDHLFCVAVVCSEQNCAPFLEDLVHDLTHAAVHYLDRLHSRVEYAGMAHHIGIGKIENDEVVLAGIDATHQLIQNPVGAHLWLQIVCGDFG